MKKQFSAFLLFLLCSCHYTMYDETYVPRQYTLESANGVVSSPDADYVQCVKKDPGRDFTIVNFTDIQSPQGLSEENRSIIRKFVNEVKPDLITLTGDQGYGGERAVAELGEFLDSFGIPWAPVFGNHDHNQQGLSIDQQCELYESFAHCLFRTGPAGMGVTDTDGKKAGNYIVNIYEDENGGGSG